MAGVTPVGQEETVFMKIENELWNGKASPGKMKGKSSWAFSLEFPETVSEKSTSKPGSPTFPLPPTFTERASPAYIDYRLTAIVRRGLIKVKQTYIFHERICVPLKLIVT